MEGLFAAVRNFLDVNTPVESSVTILPASKTAKSSENSKSESYTKPDHTARKTEKDSQSESESANGVALHNLVVKSEETENSLSSSSKINSSVLNSSVNGGQEMDLSANREGQNVNVSASHNSDVASYPDQNNSNSVSVTEDSENKHTSTTSDDVDSSVTMENTGKSSERIATDSVNSSAALTSASDVHSAEARASNAASVIANTDTVVTASNDGSVECGSVVDFLQLNKPCDSALSLRASVPPLSDSKLTVPLATPEYLTIAYLPQDKVCEQSFFILACLVLV
jgi:hypothetical protein